MHNNSISAIADSALINKLYIVFRKLLVIGLNRRGQLPQCKIKKKVYLDILICILLFFSSQFLEICIYAYHSTTGILTAVFFRRKRKRYFLY